VAGSGEAQTDGEVGTLSVPAWHLRWRAPELSLVLSERASALAAGRRDELERLRAEALAVFALNRLDMGVQATERAVAALRVAESGKNTELCWRLRVELATCARAAGVPLTGFGVLKPVLLAEGVGPELRASALVGLTDCLVLIGRSKELTDALGQADQLYGDDPGLDDDAKLLCRAVLRASAARQHRRWGDLRAAVESAKDGLGLLDQLSDRAADSGYVVSRLTLELVCALMDSEQTGDAVTAAQTVLDLPVRAPSAAAVGWLKLALATRVHLPAGRPGMANDLLRDVADSAERHQLDPLLSESMLALAHVHELAGQLSDALTCLRSAHSAERRRAGALYAVRAKLAAEFATAHRESLGLKEQLADLIKPAAKAASRSPETDAVTGLLNRRGFRRQIDAVVNGGYIDHALTLVLLDVDHAAQGGVGKAKVDDQVMRQIADKVRDTAPGTAAVGRVGGDELAVLLPDTTKDQARQWAAELQSEVAPDLAVTMTTGVAEYRPGSGGEALLTDADRALSQARVLVETGAPRRRQDDAASIADGQVDPALRPTPTNPTVELPRRRAWRDEQAAGLSTAWAQAADRWRMGNVGMPPTAIDVGPTGSTSMFTDDSAPAEDKRTPSPDGLAAFFRASGEPSTGSNEAPKAEPSSGGRRRAEDRVPAPEQAPSSRHANDNADRPGLASLVELLAAAGTGGRRRAPEPAEPEQTEATRTEAAQTDVAPTEPVREEALRTNGVEHPTQTSGTGRRRRAENFERDEIVDELRSDSGRWRLEAPLTRTHDTAASLDQAESTTPTADVATVHLEPTVPDLVPQPVSLASMSSAVDAATVVEPVTGSTPQADQPRESVLPASQESDEPRRPRSELADLLAEALVAFESTQHAEREQFDDGRYGNANGQADTNGHADLSSGRFDWQSEPTGSRHRQPDNDDSPDAPAASAEPPMLSDWVLSGKDSTPPRPDSSALTSWTPMAFGDAPATGQRDEPAVGRTGEPERDWSEWTWTPPER
jgi:diguanylate cyclase (GGDEF)-like protein